MLLVAGAVVAVLLAFASGYGYHRDERYFLAAGRHLDWAYPDQGPLTPLIARGMTGISAGSLTVLRIPSALAAVASIVLFDGHLLSTSTFDLLAWTTVSWLAVRAVRTGNDRLWLAVGGALGVGLLNKPLPAFLAAGHRPLLRTTVRTARMRGQRRPFGYGRGSCCPLL